MDLICVSEHFIKVEANMGKHDEFPTIGVRGQSRLAHLHEYLFENVSSKHWCDILLTFLGLVYAYYGTHVLAAMCTGFHY